MFVCLRSRLVEHLTHNPSIKGSNLAPGKGRMQMERLLDIVVYLSSTVVEHLTHNSWIKSSNHTPSTTRKKMAATLDMVAVAQW